MKKYFKDSVYVINPHTHVLSRSEYTGIPYSDGDEAELRIAGIIEKATDITVLSTELRQYCTDWASLYHLSGTRANILRPFFPSLSGDILEIGAGCGAITRYLGECGANVLALEGSPRRASIARSRTRDLHNVTVLAERFDQFECDQQFDVITLIGVLEYANLFTSGENPTLEMLERVRTLLKPDGKLIVAIENQLGLKYFAGAPEDHLGVPMYGIEGRYRKDQPQTFGRKALANMLEQAGFSNSEFLAPFPDYKLPVSILTEKGFVNKNFDAEAFALQSVRRDPQLPTYCNFSLELAWPSVFNNELALDLANSFLIIASPQFQSLVEEDVLAYHYSADRKPEFCKETLFKCDEMTEVFIKYNRLVNNNNDQCNDSLIKFVCPSSDSYSKGKPLSLEFIQIVTSDGWSINEVAKFIEHYLKILENIGRNQGIQIDFSSPYSIIPGTLFDAVPHNIIMKSDGDASLIDKEWDLTLPVELGHLLFRTLLQLIGSITRFGSINSNQVITRGKFIDDVLKTSGLALNKMDYDRYIEIEEQITEQVTGRSAKEAVRWWPDNQLSVLNLSQAVAERDGQIASLSQAVAERDGQIASLSQAVAERDAYYQQTLNHIRSSTSWRLTTPLRVMGKHCKRVLRILKLVPSAMKHGNGILHTAIKAICIYQNEGIGGLRRRLDSLRTPNPTQSIYSEKILDEGLAGNPKIPRVALDETCNQFIQYQKNPPIIPLVKLIAFYLPQFHPFPENDEWWGKGFTEWTNVGKAKANYLGHYQPHCPIHNGYYDLRVPDVMEEQAKLAKEYGIYGFSYYFYWFGGKILMETPLKQMLANKKVDIPFCFTWANENWSRRWDGQENDVLIAQNHSDEDSLKFIRHLIQYFMDERYIRIDGKPVLIIYRANIIPNIAFIAKIWRDEVLKFGIPGLYLVSAQSFGIGSPAPFDFDASVEFPPHTVRSDDITSSVDLLNTNYSGHIYNYDQVVSNAVLSKEPDYKLYRTAMLSWDNTARKQNNSHIFHNFSLLRYKEWLSSIVNKVYLNNKYNEDEKIVFVNAWNEWAEGTHLEPDQKFGYGYLQTTYDVLQQSINHSHKIIVVSHDAFPSGAQILALNMAKEFSQGFGVEVDIVCLGDGILKDRYAQYGHLHDLTGLDHCGFAAHNLAINLIAAGHRFAIVNTTVSGLFLQTLKEHGIKCISLIHELQGVIDQYNLYDQVKTIARMADKVVFPAQQVLDEFQAIAPVSNDRCVLRPQGLYKKNLKIYTREAARKELRKTMQLPQDALIVIGVGYADHRKGIDLFVEAGKILVSHLPNVYLIWLGHWEKTIQSRVEESLSKDSKMSSHFIFPGRREDTDLFYAGADVYALTSREDPFPSVVLEAMDASLPVVGFEGAGGCSELLAAGCGRLVKAFDVNLFSLALEDVLVNPDLANSMGKTGQVLIEEHFSFRNYLFDLLKLLEYPLPRVSVVVPNYNYAHLLRDRIKTIEAQNFPIYELIILDDFSTDDSVQVIQDIIQNSALNIKFICNSINSGSVFAQWQKGVELAKGDLVWIAEADDLSEPNFLTSVLRGFDNPNVVMSYCESKQIDLDGNVLCDNYLDYVADIGRERWLKPYIRDGHNEIVNALCVKNTIPNVSAVVFQKEILTEILKSEQEHIREFKIAGDWYVYTKLLEYGEIAFTPDPENIHRRHIKSVTNASLNLSQLAEIVRMQRMVADVHLVSASLQEVARTYAQKLYEQFGLVTSEFPNFEQALESMEQKR